MIRYLLATCILMQICYLTYSQVSFNSTYFNANGNLYDLSIGDVNGDNHLDIAVSNRSTYNQPGQFSIVMGKPDGTFSSPSSFNTTMTPIALELGDFNGDNMLDLVATQYYLGSNIMYFKGNGDGTFAVESQIGTAYRFTEDIALGDINGDEKVDLVTGGNELLFAYINEGTIPFNKSFTDQIPNPVNSTDGISLSDVNKDGFDDIVTVNKGIGAVLVYISKGDGTFYPFVEYTATTSAEKRTRGVWCDDFNGDTYPDIVVANEGRSTAEGNHIAVFLNKKDGSFLPAVQYYTTDLPRWPVTSDFNLDGFKDIAVSSSEGVNLFFGKGDGTFNNKKVVSNLAGHKLKVADFNKDGYPDIAHATSSNDLEVLYNCPKANSTIDITACESYTSPSGRYTWNSTGTYSDTIASAENCDSIITINLTVLFDVPVTETISVCDSFFWQANGLTYKESGNYSTTLISKHGCDSTVFLQLTIANSTKTYDTVKACKSFLWSTNNNLYTQGGDYIDTLTGHNGCDSVIYLNLTITSINDSVSRSENTLVSHDTAAQFQWLDCNNHMKPLESQTKQVFTGEIGRYAVELTLNNCIDTSLCYELNASGISPSLLPEDIQIYPNPTTGRILVKTHEANRILSIQIMNSSGIQLKSLSVVNNVSHEVNIDHAPGLYFIQVTTNKGKRIYKIIKL